MPQPLMLKKMKLYRSMKTTCLLEVMTFYRGNTKKRYYFHHRDRNVKIGSQELSGVTGKFGLGVPNEAGQRLTVLPRELTGHTKHPLPTTQEKTLHMDITRWSIAKSD